MRLSATWGPRHKFKGELTEPRRTLGKQQHQVSRRLVQELEGTHKCGRRKFYNIKVDEANLLTWQGLIAPDNLPYDKGAFRIKSTLPQTTRSNHQ